MFNFFKNKNKKTQWQNIEYPISSQIISNKLINRMVDRFFKEHLSEVVLEKQFLVLMVRFRLNNTNEIRTFCKLQKLRISSKEYLKKFIEIKSLMLQDDYENQPVSGIIFSWGVRDFSKLRQEFTDSICEQMVGTNKKDIVRIIHNKISIPINTDLSKWGRIITDHPFFKNIDLTRGRTITVQIQERDGITYYKCQLFNHNIEKANWEDKIISFSEDKLIRSIGSTIIEYEQDNIKVKHTIIKTRKMAKIKPSKKIDNKIIAGDLETVLDPNNKMKPFLISFKSNSDIKHYFESTPITLFNKFFKKVLIRKYRSHHIYFHNLSGFDGQFLFSQLVNAGYEIDPMIHKGKLICIEVWDPNKPRNIWYFKDSNHLLLNSLDKLSKSFELTKNKGIFPYYLKDINYKGVFPSYDLFNQFKTSLERYKTEKDNWVACTMRNHNKIWEFRNESISYCLNDSILLFEILNKFNQFIFNKYKLNINNYPTLPSLAFAIFRKDYLKENEIPIITGKVKEEISKGYTGGSTDMFIPALENKKFWDDYGNLMEIEDKKIYAYDVNSLYPSVMKENDFPIGNPAQVEFNYFYLNDNEESNKLFGHFYCDITAPEDLKYPILQIHYKGENGIRTISPVGNFSGWFFSEELKNSLKFGYKIKILRGYQFSRGKIFNGWVEDQYKLRTSYPKSHPMNYIGKILLNSLYGRFGMTDQFLDFILLDNLEFKNFDFVNNQVEEVINFKDKFLVKYKNKVTLEEELKGSYNSGFINVSIPIASAVTAYARIHMSQFKDPKFMSLYDYNLYYSDTDSIYTDRPLPDKFISNSRLGALKLEGIYDKAIFLAPKVYALKNTKEEIIKIKGLSKESIWKHGLNIEILETLLKKDSILNLTQDKWFKSLSEGSIQILEQTYSLKVTANKRNLLYNSEQILVNTTPILLR